MTRLMVKMRLIISSLVFLLVLSACQKKQTAPQETMPAEEAIQLPSWITINYVMGHFDPADSPLFVDIPTEYADREGLMLRQDTWEAFQMMAKSAEDAGHKLVIRSATRNFNYQKGIWERKWNGTTTLEGGTKATDIEEPVARAKKILLYSSMPGTSRHHWGTDIDINSFNNDYFTTGEGKELYKWMQENAADFGFCQPYTDKSDGRSGYEEEKWHWTYVPIAHLLTEYSRRYLKDSMIEGFEGAETATEVGMLSNYVLGIDKSCL